MTGKESASGRRSKAFSYLIIAFVSLMVFAFGILMLVKNNQPPKIKIPQRSLPQINGWDDIVKATDMLPKINVKGSPNKNGIYIECGPVSAHRNWPTSEYGRFLKANAPAFAVLRKGLAKPCMCPPIRKTSDSLSLFTSLTYMRELSTRLRGEAMYYDHIGKPEKASDSLLDSTQLGVMMLNGANLIISLNGRSIEWNSLRQLEPLLAKLQPADLERVAKRLEQIEKMRIPYSDIVLEEGYATTAMNLECMRDPTTLRQIKDPRNWVKNDLFAVDDSNSPRFFWRNANFAMGNKSKMMRYNLEYYKTVASEQRGYYTGDSKVPTPQNFIFKSLYCDIKNSRRGSVRNEAVFAMLQVEIALQRYYAEHSKYPVNLSELAPKYLKSVPKDPFGRGKPLRYRVTKNGQGFLLYSLGLNMKDDGGKPGKWDYIADTMEYDLVAGSF